MALRDSKVLRIGVLVPEEVQLLDLATVDLLAMLSQDYLSRAKLPAPLIAMGIPEVKIYYIAEKLDDKFQSTTAGAIRITHGIDDEEVQPGKLDIIHIPGPFLPPTISKSFKDFAKSHQHYTFENGRKVVFLVVCTGIFVAGSCGLLEGKAVTGPRMALFDLQIMYPTSSWDWDKRWVRDGDLWTCGTICNGLDMIPAFMLEAFPRALVEVLLFISQVPDRSQSYESTRGGASLMRNFWWLSSWVMNSVGLKMI